MMRTNFLRGMMGAGLAILINGVALAQSDFSQVEITAEKVSEKVYMLKGRGGNIGLCVGEDGIIMIDDQYAPLSEKIKAAVAKISDKPIKFVINTHWHGDHAGGNENFGKSGSVIVAHENVYQRLSTDQFMKRFKRKIPAAPHVARPVITFLDQMRFHFNDTPLHVIHGPNAHTDGDALVYFPEENVIHTGDAFVRYGYPFVDVGSGGTIDGFISFLDRIIILINEDTQVIPGHGDLATKQDVVELRKILDEIREKVMGQLKEGADLGSILEAKLTEAYDEKMNQGFIKADDFVTMIYTAYRIQSDGE